MLSFKSGKVRIVNIMLYAGPAIAFRAVEPSQTMRAKFRAAV